MGDGGDGEFIEGTQSRSPTVLQIVFKRCLLVTPKSPRGESQTFGVGVQRRGAGGHLGANAKKRKDAASIQASGKRVVLISVPTGGSISIKIKGHAILFLLRCVSVTPENFF